MNQTSLVIGGTSTRHVTLRQESGRISLDGLLAQRVLSIRAGNANPDRRGQPPGLVGPGNLLGLQSAYNGNDSAASVQTRYLVAGRVATSAHTLVNHGLGYVPLAFVAYGGRMLMPGVAVQTGSGGRSRFVAPYITSSAVALREVYNSSSLGLGAVSRSYQVMVFRTPVENAALPLFSGDGSEVVIGRGKISTEQTYARKDGAGQRRSISTKGGLLI